MGYIACCESSGPFSFITILNEIERKLAFYSFQFLLLKLLYVYLALSYFTVSTHQLFHKYTYLYKET